jgi:hypothetical protein
MTGDTDALWYGYVTRRVFGEEDPQIIRSSKPMKTERGAQSWRANALMALLKSHSPESCTTTAYSSVGQHNVAAYDAVLLNVSDGTRYVSNVYRAAQPYSS